MTLTFSAYKLASLTLKITHRLISEMHGREKVWWLKLNVVFTLLRVLHEGRESRFEPGWLAGICIKSKDPLCGLPVPSRLIFAPFTHSCETLKRASFTVSIVPS